jgi:hypothetical protein
MTSCFRQRQIPKQTVGTCGRIRSKTARDANRQSRLEIIESHFASARTWMDGIEAGMT